MRPKLRRVVSLAVVGLLGCWMAALPGTASTAPGDVTRVGGQGPNAGCRDNEAPADKQGDDGRAGLSSAHFHWSPFSLIRSIAVDASGTRIFVPDRSVIRGVNGHVAGVPPRDPPSSSTTSSTLYNVAKWGLTGEAAEGADAKAVALRPLAVAVDSKAQNLYILEANSVRHVNLQEQVPTIRTIAGPAVGTTITASISSVIAADIFGRVFIGDAGSSGTIYRLDTATRTLTTLTTVENGVGSLSVDAGGTALYAAEKFGGEVFRIDPVSGARSVVAGGGASDQDGGAATSARLIVEAVAVDPLGGHLYISDGVTHRIRKVDLSTGVINSVVGSGQTVYQESGKAASFAFTEPYAIAVDLSGSVFMLMPNDCALFMAVTPAVIFTPPPPSNPPTPQPPPTTPAGPTGQDSTNTGSQTAPETVGAGNQGTVPQQTGAPADPTPILSGDQGAGAAQPQTELRIIDQGNAVTTPGPAAQPTVEPVPTPGPAAQFTPTPVQAPTVVQAPTPAGDAGTVTVADPGTSSVGVTPDAAPAVPPAPAAAPVPPAPASAPPPAAQQPVSNVGLAHGDSAAPTRGATRYAMVRNDEEQSLVAAMAMAGAGAMVAVFLCVMFVAPGASSKPKPRPKGAY